MTYGETAMRKTILLMLLAAVSGNAAAEWVEVRRVEDETLYVVPTTIRKVGDKANLWALTDYKSPRKTTASPEKPYLSEMAQKEYDCKEEKFRTLFSSAHAGNMSGGAAVQISAVPGNWTPIPPGSTDEALRKIGCGM
jgi:hypothetical protein